MFWEELVRSSNGRQGSNDSVSPPSIRGETQRNLTYCQTENLLVLLLGESKVEKDNLIGCSEASMICYQLITTRAGMYSWTEVHTVSNVASQY